MKILKKYSAKLKGTQLQHLPTKRKFDEVIPPVQVNVALKQYIVVRFGDFTW